MATHEAVLEALGDGTRRRIVEELRNGAASVAALADVLPVSRPAVSQHLRVLRECGLVTFEEEGTKNLYRLDRRGLEILRGWVEEFWDDALARFEEHIRNEGKRS